MSEKILVTYAACTCSTVGVTLDEKKTGLISAQFLGALFNPQ